MPDSGRLSRGLTGLAVVALSLAALPTSLFAQAAMAQAPPQKAKDEMRQPWQRGEGPFIRRWLLLGEFPYKGTDVDLLTEHGGEAAIQPVAGMTHKRPDGSETAWQAHASDGDTIDFTKAFAGRPTSEVVAYGFTTVDWPAEESAALLLGSSDGVSVWLNGERVHQVSGSRGVTLDEDQVEMKMRAGANRILLKVDNASGRWGFAARIVKWDPPRRPHPLVARIEASEGDTLTLSTNAALGTVGPVEVEVLAAGGAVRARQTSTRGARVRFATARWPSGAYDIRVTGQDWQGRRTRVFLGWYKGDMLAALERLVDTAPKEHGGVPARMHHAMLADMVKDRMRGRLDSLEGAPVKALHNILMELEELEQEAKGGAGGAHASGFVRLAYEDEIDGSPQFCRAYLPGDYDPSQKWPMVVYLHKYNPRDPVYVQWWDADVRHRGDLAERHNVIFLEPHGRGNTQYQGIGERDVLRCIAMAKKRLSVDDDRVYLRGESMGGAGTWSVASRHPQLFAAIAPVFGGFDYHNRLSKERIEALSPRERYLFEQASSYAQADALLGVPVFVHHGDADDAVPVEESRYAVRMLQRWGYDIRYREHPGLGHRITGIDDELTEWMLRHKRDAHPRRVRVRSASLGAASAHWLTIEQREKQDAFMVADAAIAGPNTIRLDTDNVLAAVLTPGKALVDPTKPLRVIWNGTPHTVAMAAGRARLAASGDSAHGPRKTAAVEGPLRAAMATPFAVVVGTVSESAMMRRLCEAKGQALAEAWRRSQHQPLRLYRDTEIAEQDIARYSLVLIGGSDANAVTRKLAAALPLKIEGSTVTIGGRAFEAPDAVATLLHPHPLNAERYVVVAAATSPAGMYFLDLLNDGLSAYDFHVADGAVANAQQGRPAEKVRIAAGTFDREWKLDPALLETADPAVRDRCPRVRVGPDLKADVADPPQVPPLALEGYAGEYRSGAKTARVVKAGERLMLEVSGRAPTPLYRETDTVFGVVGMDVTVTFVKDPSGTVVGVRLRGPDGAEAECKKVQ